MVLGMQEGRRVLLLERDLSQPDRIVGELLQPGGYLMLKKLGLEACTDNIDAVKVSPPKGIASRGLGKVWKGILLPGRLQSAAPQSNASRAP